MQQVEPQQDEKSPPPVAQPPLALRQRPPKNRRWSLVHSQGISSTKRAVLNKKETGSKAQLAPAGTLAMGHNLCRSHFGADEHPCTTYCYVHQGYKVLTHGQLLWAFWASLYTDCGPPGCLLVLLVFFLGNRAKGEQLFWKVSLRAVA